MEDIPDDDLYGSTTTADSTSASIPSFFINNQTDAIQQVVLMGVSNNLYLIICISEPNENIKDWMGNQWNILSDQPTYTQHILQSSIFFAVNNTSFNFQFLQQAYPSEMKNKIVVIAPNGKVTTVFDQIPRTIDQFVHKFLKMRKETEGEDKFKDVKFPIIISSETDALIAKTKQKKSVVEILQRQKEALKESTPPSPTETKETIQNSNDDKKKLMEEKLRMARLKDQEIRKRKQQEEQERLNRLEKQKEIVSSSIPSIITPENYPVEQTANESTKKQEKEAIKKFPPNSISILVKLPNSNTSQKQTLPLEASMKDVFNFTDSLIDNTLINNYELVIAFPKKVFQKNDSNFLLSLQELHLFPSASFLLRWNEQTEQLQKGYVTLIMDKIVAWYHIFVSWVTSFLFLKPNRPIPATQPSQQETESQPSSSRTIPDHVAKRKIHTLSTKQQEETKNKSNWNGNSIQTMDKDEKDDKKNK